MGIQNICWICSGQIVDMYFLTVGSKFTIHMECLKCSVCLQKLEMQSKCFVRRGRFFCGEHYATDREATCSGCHARLMPNDYVIRPNLQHTYHMSCFKCSQCLRQIEPGSKHAIINDSVFCSQHYLGMDESLDLNNNNQDALRYEHSFSSSSLDSSPMPFNPQLKPLENRSTSSSSKASATSGSTRKKRLRTSFKHQQLRIMKAHFQINQNPDSKDLKELSERTGLQKRVLQVWFQNSRAKQRKSSSSSSNGQYAVFTGIIANQTQSKQQGDDANYADDDQESNDDENLEYDVEDELNESNSKSLDENFSNAPSEQTQYFNQQSIFDFYNCF